MTLVGCVEVVGGVGVGGEDKLLDPQDSGDITASNGKNLQQLDFQSAVLVCLPGLDGSHTHRHTHTHSR